MGVLAGTLTFFLSVLLILKENAAQNSKAGEVPW